MKDGQAGHPVVVWEVDGMDPCEFFHPHQDVSTYFD